MLTNIYMFECPLFVFCYLFFFTVQQISPVYNTHLPSLVIYRLAFMFLPLYRLLKWNVDSLCMKGWMKPRQSGLTEYRAGNQTSI